MIPDLLTVRRSTRLAAAKLVPTSLIKTVEAVTPPTPPVVVDSPVERMAKRNPAFTQLVESLDLVVVWSHRGMKGEPLPELVVAAPAEPETPKLKQIASRVFLANETYNETQALGRIAKLLGVSIERATNGLLMMQRQGLVSLTLSNEFYLTESTPF